jgi:hypothetical protein
LDAGAAVAGLDLAIDDLVAAYRLAMGIPAYPWNGWGDLTGTLRHLRALRDLCAQRPDWVFCFGLDPFQNLIPRRQP